MRDLFQRAPAFSTQKHDKYLENLLASMNQTPLRDKKKTKRISDDENSEVSQNSVTGGEASSLSSLSARPLRKAAAKANLDLKEKPIGTKMRQENSRVVVKVEKLSLENLNLSENDRNLMNVVKKERITDASQNNNKTASSKKKQPAPAPPPSAKDTQKVLGEFLNIKFCF